MGGALSAWKNAPNDSGAALLALAPFALPLRFANCDFGKRWIESKTGSDLAMPMSAEQCSASSRDALQSGPTRGSVPYSEQREVTISAQVTFFSWLRHAQSQRFPFACWIRSVE